MNSNISIILVSPQMGENIGAAARAMLNFGLTDLRLVNPRDGWPNERAIDMSSGALDVMPPVQVFDTLNDAAADLNILYATTARVRDMVKPVFTPRSAAEDASARIDQDQKIGFVFGAERAGLSNDEIAACHNIINIPTNPDFSSLNLGQAVLLEAHEMFQTRDQTPDKKLDMGDSVPAPLAEFDEFAGRLNTALDERGFFSTPEIKPTMVKNLRNILIRSQPSSREVKTLHGVLSAFIKKRGE